MANISQEQIKRVAEWFGWWHVVPAGVAIRGKQEFVGVIKIPGMIEIDPVFFKINENSIFLFTAYAKAKAAKRGWVNEIITWIDDDGRRHAEVNFYKEAHEYGACPVIYDPTEPLSEAEAIIQCIDEIASATGPFEKPAQ